MPWYDWPVAALTGKASTPGSRGVVQGFRHGAAPASTIAAVFSDKSTDQPQAIAVTLSTVR